MVLLRRLSLAAVFLFAAVSAHAQGTVLYYTGPNLKAGDGVVASGPSSVQDAGAPFATLTSPPPLIPGDIALTTATGVQDGGVAPLTPPFPIADGGTGATTGQGAASNLSLGYVLCQSAVAGMSHTGDATETALATCTVPANLLGLNGCLQVTGSFTSTNDSSTKTVRVRFSGISGTAFMSQALTTTSSYSWQFTMCNRGATNSQTALSSSNAVGGTSGGVPPTSSVDTTAATTLVFTGQLGATTTDTVTLVGYSVMYLPAPGN